MLGQENSAVSKQSFVDLSSSRCLRGQWFQNQSPKHPLVDYTLHFKGVELMQDKAYLSPHPFPSVSFVFKSYLTLSFHSEKLAVGWRKVSGRQKRERKSRKGEGITGFSKLSV